MDALVPLTVAVPILPAAAFVGLRTLCPKSIADLGAAAAATAGAVLASILLFRSFAGPLVYWFGGWRPRGDVAVGVAFAVDPLGAAFAALACLLVAAALVFSVRYFLHHEPLYHVLALVFLGGMIGMALTGDVFNLFVFFELMSVPAFALTAFKTEEAGPLQGGFAFGVVNSLGAFFVLSGIGLLYARTGALNMAQIGESLARDGRADGLVVVAFTLFAVGFLVKAGAVPFHFWLADAYAVAPAPMCAVFAGVMTEFGLYALARVYWTMFEGVLGQWDGAIRGVLLGVGLLTALLGAVMALLQRHLKRMLAYSAIASTGSFLVGIALLTPDGLAGTSLYVLVHALATAALFLAVGILLVRLGGVDELDLRGRGRELPWVGAAWGLAALALAGPPFAGTFLGRSLIEDSGSSLGLPWIAPVLAAATIISTGAIARAGLRIFLGWGPGEDALLTRQPSEEPPEGRTIEGVTLMSWVAAVLAVASLGLGAWPGLASRAQLAAERFQGREAYVARVLHGRPPPELGLPRHRTTGTGILWSVVSTAGAAAVAGGLLARRRVRAPLRRASWRVAGPGVRALRAVHSGYIVDYVAWLTFGTAALGALFALTLR